MPKRSSTLPTRTCSRSTGSDATAGPAATTMATTRASAATAPAAVDRHPRTIPAARTTVIASTASTAEPKKAADMTPPAWVRVIMATLCTPHVHNGNELTAYNPFDMGMDLD